MFDKNKVLAKVTVETKEARPSHEENSIQDERLIHENSNRKRRSLTVNPPVEHLQRNAYLNYMGRVAQENRDFLNRIGKRGQ